MSFLRLVLRNLLFHWRGNLAVVLGVAVGTAVLTGALVVGDSLRGSLRQRTLQQLGWVDHALVSSHFVHEGLARELPAERACPVILLQGSATGPAQDTVGRVTILGVDERFWGDEPVPLGWEFWHPVGPVDPSRSQVVLSAALAKDLDVKQGDLVTLQMPRPGTVPHESLLGQRSADRTTLTVKLRVARILPADDLGSRFSLAPSPVAPRNALIPLRMLQALLQEALQDDSSSLDLTGRVNAFLVQGDSDSLKQALRGKLTLEDWGLVIRDPASRTRTLFARHAQANPEKLTFAQWRTLPTVLRDLARDHGRILTPSVVEEFYRTQRGYLSLESQQMLLEPAVEEAALTAAKDEHLQTAPTLIYIADNLTDGTTNRAYVIVAAVDTGMEGSFEPLLPAGVRGLANDQLVLVQTEPPLLGEHPGEKIQLRYYPPEGAERPRSETFTVKQPSLPLDSAALDADLTPEVPGITDREDPDQGRAPPEIHYDPKRRTPEDRKDWRDYGSIPRAYVTLGTGQRLWGSRFGRLTSVRLRPTDDRSLETAAKDYRRRLEAALDPEKGGFVFDAVAARRLEAANQGTDFGGLFLGFSLFLIVAALLLVGLLFRLSLDRRASEVGVLLATGYRRSTVRWLLLTEGAFLAILGGLLGLAAALGYARLLLALLAAWWPAALEHSFLRLHVTVPSLAIGFGASLIVTLLTIAWTVRALGKVPARALLAGETTDESAPGRGERPARWSLWIGGVSVVGAAALIGAGCFVHDPEAQASSFFGGGALLLTALLAGLWAAMRQGRLGFASSGGSLSLLGLAVRSACRQPLRSLLTAGLLASAVFVVVAVQCFHRDVGSDLHEPKSGTGGYALLGETDVPLYQKPDSSEGKKDLSQRLKRRLEKAGTSAADSEQQLKSARATLDKASFVSFRLRQGDDASCLNLAQPRRPRLLGVPAAFIDQDRFRFADSVARDADQRANPWLLLNQRQEDGAIPVIADATTAEWALHKGLGDTLEVPDEQGKPVTLRLVGLLQGSIFQSELLLSEDNFKALYPGQQGYNYFLVAAPPEDVPAIKHLLSQEGLEMTSTAERLKSYLEVENTYLATFQALGGLGLVLGSLGLGVVLLRGAWERRGELALLRALGFRRETLGGLVLAENGLLLLAGLGAGSLAAFLAVAPHLVLGSGTVPLLRLTGLLALALIVGLAAGAAAVATTLRTPLLPALRRE